MYKFLAESTKKKQAEEEMLKLTIEKVSSVNILIFFREIKNLKRIALKK